MTPADNRASLRVIARRSPFKWTPNYRLCKRVSRQAGTCLVFPARRGNQPLEKHVEDAECQGSPERRGEAQDVKAGNKNGGEFNHDGIDHKPEDPKRDD